MKGTEQFEKVVFNHLLGIANMDKAFEAKLNDPKKNIKDCITYILNSVKKSGCNGFADEEIFGMAMHYYDEEKIEVGKPISARVVVNHTDFQGKKVSVPQKQKAVKQKSVTEPFEQLSMF